MSLAAAVNASEIIPKIGIDFQGGLNQNVTNISPAGNTVFNNSNNVSAGMDIGAEYLVNSDSVFNYGFGIEYLFRRVTNVADLSQTLNFMPLYLTGQYRFWDSLACKPYVKLNLGWNLSYTGNSDYALGASLNGGMYWAVGIGGKVYKDTIIAELMYSTYMGKHSGYTLENDEGDIFTFDTNDTYSVLGLKVGYCFDLCGKCGK